MAHNTRTRKRVSLCSMRRERGVPRFFFHTFTGRRGLCPLPPALNTRRAWCHTAHTHACHPPPPPHTHTHTHTMRRAASSLVSAAATALARNAGATRAPARPRHPFAPPPDRRCRRRAPPPPRPGGRLVWGAATVDCRGRAASARARCRRAGGAARRRCCRKRVCGRHRRRWRCLRPRRRTPPHWSARPSAPTNPPSLCASGGTASWRGCVGAAGGTCWPGGGPRGGGG